MGILDTLKKSGSELKGQWAAEEELNSKLSEIDQAISNLEEQRQKIDDIIEEKIDRILEDKISAHKINQSVAFYKKENDDFIKELRENIRVKYRDFIDDNMSILQNAKTRLRLLKDFQAQNN